PIIIFDALRVKIRDEGVVRNKAVYLALGFTIEGHKEILGLWIEQTEGAKFWLRVMTEIKNRGGAATSSSPSSMASRVSPRPAFRPASCT
ncbi:MAG: hypothetical protein HN650_05410, partial [Rhodospirillaceae bacterium]|nr:hypothetical protein [Rhodospirillaceae bacterium]